MLLAFVFFLLFVCTCVCACAGAGAGACFSQQLAVRDGELRVSDYQANSAAASAVKGLLPCCSPGVELAFELKGSRAALLGKPELRMQQPGTTRNPFPTPPSSLPHLPEFFAQFEASQCRQQGRERIK